MRGGAEYQLQLYVIGLLRYSARPDVLWYHCPNGEARSATTGARLKAMGVMPGVADVCLTIKGRSYYLELKRAKGLTTVQGRLSPEQWAFREAAVAAGAVYEVARTPERAKAILASWGALRPDSIGDIVQHIQGAA